MIRNSFLQCMIYTFHFFFKTTHRINMSLFYFLTASSHKNKKENKNNRYIHNVLKTGILLPRGNFLGKKVGHAAFLPKPFSLSRNPSVFTYLFVHTDEILNFIWTKSWNCIKEHKNLNVWTCDLTPTPFFLR